MFRVLLAVSHVLLLAACASIPAHHLSKLEVDSYKLVGVTASVAPDAKIEWGVGDTPEAREQTREQATRRLQEYLLKFLAEEMHGSQPVRLEVQIHHIRVPSNTERVLIGGIPSLEATAVLKNASTGTQIAVLERHKVSATQAGGIGGILVDAMMNDDTYDKLMLSYGLQYRVWLLGR
jgi:hypothetical protein